MRVSATGGAGLDELRRAMVDALTGGEPLRDPTRSRTCVTRRCSRARERTCRTRAVRPLRRARPRNSCSPICTPRAAVLGEVVGAHTSEDVLQHIFERFCIGK